jgi:hypothetical protein
LRFDLVASSSDFVIGTVPAALNNAGLVAFAGGTEQLLVGGNGAATAFDLSAWGLERLIRVALDDAGDVAFLAATPTSGTEFGAFATNITGSTPAVLYAPELGGGLGDTGFLESSSRLAMAANGIVTFSSIQDSQGALYRGPVTGTIELLHTGGNGFANNQELDVNAGGTVINQMEHSGCGLQRGILVFDTPELPIEDTFKAIAGLGVSQQPDGALNDSGVVALALSGTEPEVGVLRCPAGEPFERFNVALGVYTAVPTPLSDPPNLSLVTDTTGAFASFGAVDINNAGTVVFEATLDAGGRGIFRGPDAVANKIVAAGDTLGGEVITDVQLGQLNDNCQLSMATVSASGRSVWRVSGIRP